MGPALLSGTWRDLAVLSWWVDPARLAAHVPVGLEADTWDGRALISVVGVSFLDLRLAGVPVPGLRTLIQVNVRIYVRRRVAGEVRHGVRFLLQLAPSVVAAAGARLALHEPYRSRDMRLDDVRQPRGRRTLVYGWREDRELTDGDVTPGGRAARDPWQHVRVVVGPERRLEGGPGTLETFILQRCWGYTPQPDGTTLEYAVQHPQWWTRPVEAAHLEAAWGEDLLPADVAALLGTSPDVALFAEGSAIEVHRPERLSFPSGT